MIAALVLIVIVILMIFMNGYDLLTFINNFYKQEDEIFFETPQFDILRRNWETIRDEYKKYPKDVERYAYFDSVQATIDTGEVPWNTIILRMYNRDSNNVKFFPKTMELLEQIPGCSVAMISILPPGKYIPPHTGPYNGVLRYHLALETDPVNWSNCIINIDGETYAWKQGEDVLFDDTKLHWVHNNTESERVVLFLDIEKPGIMNKIIMSFARYNSTVRNIIKRVDQLSD
jgi:beta-hydroxylase